MGYGKLAVRITPVGSGCGHFEIRHACSNTESINGERYSTRQDAVEFIHKDNARLNKEEHKKYLIINNN